MAELVVAGVQPRHDTSDQRFFFSDPEKGVRVQRLSKSLEEQAAALEAASFHTLHSCEALGQEIVQPAIENTRDAAKDCRAFVIVMNGLNLIRRAPKWNKQKLQDSGMNSGTGVLPDLLVSSPATSPNSTPATPQFISVPNISREMPTTTS